MYLTLTIDWSIDKYRNRILEENLPKPILEIINLENTNTSFFNKEKFYKYGMLNFVDTEYGPVSNLSTNLDPDDDFYKPMLKNTIDKLMFDVDKLEEAFWQVFIEAIASFGACCCGIVVLLIGIILAFTMEDPQAAYDGNAQDSNLLNQNTGNMPKSSSAWDEKEDYIHREKKDDEVPDDRESEVADDKVETEEKNRSGEYEMPPPPET